MNAYVAAKFEDQERTRQVQRRLVELGYTITFDWTSEDDTGMSEEEKKQYWAHCGLRDVAGVRDCDLFFQLAHPNGMGSMTELGIAMGLNRHIVVVEPERARNIFFTVPWVAKFGSIDEGIEYAAQLIKKPSFRGKGATLLLSPLTLPSTVQVLLEIAWERIRQDEKWGEQNHPDGTGAIHFQQLRDACQEECEAAAKAGTLTFAHISQEEHYEALAESDEVKLEAELLQDAAVKVEWIESIRRRRSNRNALPPMGEESGPSRAANEGNT